MSGPIPESLFTAFAATTVFTVMFSIGLGITLGDLHWSWQRPGPLARGLFAVLVAVPALAVVIARCFGLPRFAEIGVVLMAISPGAPVALRRSLGAGGHRALAPSLQIGLAVLAVASMPLSIAALNHVYAGHAAISPRLVARQVFVAQLLPLGLGVTFRRLSESLASRLEPRLTRIATLLLVALAVLAMIALWKVTIHAGFRVVATVALTTSAALAVGHLLGGPDPATRTAVAIISAARNPGLALMVATLNAAPIEVQATVLAYIPVSLGTVIPYLVWRRRAAARVPHPG